nr:MAG TPA: Membrane-anchored junction protein [Caudoviricetes sp.]
MNGNKLLNNLLFEGYFDSGYTTIRNMSKYILFYGII